MRAVISTAARASRRRGGDPGLQEQRFGSPGAKRYPVPVESVNADNDVFVGQ